MNTYPPISDDALIGDCRGGALVSRDGSIDWCAFHRFVASPVFARILDWEQGGHFRIAPRDECEATRRYLPGTNVLETTFETATGAIALTDCFVVDPNGGHSEHRLVRLVECTRGEGRSGSSSNRASTTASRLRGSKCSAASWPSSRAARTRSSSRASCPSSMPT